MAFRNSFVWLRLAAIALLSSLDGAEDLETVFGLSNRIVNLS